MNNYRRTRTCSRILGLLLVLIACLTFLPSCASNETPEQTPPKPKEPATILSMPAAIEPEVVRGKASLPEELVLGFALDVGDTVLAGDWDVVASVIGLENRTVIFKTEKGEIGHLVYRIPKGMQFPLLEPKQPISIKRNLRGYEASLGYQLQVTSEDALMLSSGRIFGGKPQEAAISQRLLLQQIPDKATVLSESKYETIYQVPVYLIVDKKPVELKLGELTEFMLDGKIFLIMVTESSNVIPNEEYKGVVEGKGYALEYVLVLK